MRLPVICFYSMLISQAINFFSLSRSAFSLLLEILIYNLFTFRYGTGELATGDMVLLLVFFDRGQLLKYTTNQ